MPVLSHTGTADKEQIRAAFLPFARPDYITGMLIGDDLDSLLSAMFLHRHFGWPVKAVYCRYSRIWYNDAPEEFKRQLYSGRLFAVDLDIYHPAVPSLGHHMIAWDGAGELPGHSHSLNPNAVRGFTVEHDYRRKYPLATIHFLQWLLDADTGSAGAGLLTWLADSAFINAQRYRENVEEWVRNYLSLPGFVEMLPALQNPDFERALQETILSPMSSNPLCRSSRSTYRSKYLGLNGFQCQFENPQIQNAAIRSLLRLLSELSGWPHLPFPETFEYDMEGRRREVRLAEIRNSGLTLGTWLEYAGVFSYAFTYSDRLNCTIL